MPVLIPLIIHYERTFLMEDQEDQTDNVVLTVLLIVFWLIQRELTANWLWHLRVGLTPGPCWDWWVSAEYCGRNTYTWTKWERMGAYKDKSSPRKNIEASVWIYTNATCWDSVWFLREMLTYLPATLPWDYFLKVCQTGLCLTRLLLHFLAFPVGFK